MSRRRRLGGLARRYGHASMTQVRSAVSDVKKLAEENPTVSAVIIGAGVGALAGEMGVATGAIMGAMAGVAAEKITSK